MGQAAGPQTGTGLTELSNGFAACDDPALQQRICDSLQPGTIEVFFQRWLHRLPLPLGPADRDAGCWWELSMAQVEVSRSRRPASPAITPSPPARQQPPAAAAPRTDRRASSS